MPNDKEAVVAFPEENLIYVFDLENKNVRKIKHFYFSQIGCSN